MRLRAGIGEAVGEDFGGQRFRHDDDDDDDECLSLCVSFMRAKAGLVLRPLFCGGRF